MDLDSQEAEGGKRIGQKVSQRLSGEAHLAGLETDGLPHLPARIPKQCMEKNHCRAQEDHQGFLPQPQNALGIAAEWLHAGTLLLLLHSTADPHVALSYLRVNICLL